MYVFGNIWNYFYFVYGDALRPYQDITLTVEKGCKKRTITFAGKQRSRLEHGEDVQSTHLQSETTGQNYQRYPLGQQHNGVILREQSMKSQPLPNNLINLTNLQKPNMGPTVVRHSMQNGLSHMSELPQQQMVQYSGLQRNHGEEHHPRGLTVHRDDGQQEMSENLERQIEELNRQHADAQDKLRRLMDQQHTVEGQVRNSFV